MSKICNNCGKELGDFDKFCPSCGAPVEDTIPEPTTTPVEPSYGNTGSMRPEDIPMPGAGNAGNRVPPQSEYRSSPGGQVPPQGGYSGNAGGQVPPQGVPQGDGQYQQSVNPPGKSQATASLVLGLVSAALFIFGLGIIGIITSAIGLVQANKAKALGFNEGTRTAGFVINLIMLIICIIGLVACGALIGLVGVGIANGAASSGQEISDILGMLENI